MNNIKFNKTSFLKSIINTCELEDFSGIEIAVLGYSNSGKSSLLNVLTNNKKLARVSKLPGRTRTINVFDVMSSFRIIDFPGYGYSTINLLTKKLITKSLFFYLRHRLCLRGVMILSDIRYSLKLLDLKILKILKKRSVSILFVLTKTDKVSKQKKIIQISQIRKKISILNMDITVLVFSKFSKLDILVIRHHLSVWYNLFWNR
ncbi:ribosome biogenesis GTP-binding protein YihA/YsxC [Buchnera aphidicola]|uniref:Probable GTP-binding protein EngB n=1 Tax=Buchnera aphidicola (Cinara cf. splendens/pseudotsugae 3390) TaxID=2518980 RepID=A0A451CX93_9GAMM|nr:ribosome biogenesis GTP-binding protein YihA/YsxC [Buchnera aphidicola]VFP77851.1 Probable GTP-binding protein EngB [Buchnera aphidicola (Cinara cf. splendens/pseudotsugae 3390)]